MAIAAEPLSSEGDAVSIGQPAGMQPGGAALHQGAVPIFAFISRIAEHAVLNGHARHGFGIGKSCAELDDTAQSGGTVENAARSFDDLYLFEVLEGQKTPCRASCISAQDGQAVQEDSDTGARSKTVSASAADLRLAVHNGDARRAGQTLVRTGGCTLVHEFRRKDVNGHAYFSKVLFVTPCRNDRGADAGHIGLECNV